jgi:glycosyltransferase involved in cell wall biosynthesis
MEIIVVDDASTDDTLATIQNYEVNIISNDRNYGAAYSRNVGAANASSDILIFVDSDVIVPIDGISRLAESLIKHSDALIATAIYSDETKDLNFISDYKNLEIIYKTKSSPTYVKYLGSYFFAIRRSTFTETGGFSINFKGAIVEDIDFGIKVSKGEKKIFIDRTIQVKHLKIHTLYSMLKIDMTRVVHMMMILRNSKGKLKLDDYGSLSDYINLFLPFFSILFIGATLTFFINLFYLNVLFILVFLVNNKKIITYWINKRGFTFAIKGLFVLFIQYISVLIAVSMSFFVLTKQQVKEG